MKFGDHLVSPRIGYSHHGIYVGDNQVIHYSGFANGMSKGEISLTCLDDFSQGRKVRVKKHLVRIYDPNESVGRAYSRIGEDWYNVLLNNCEHFVNWCINGLHSSSQVNNLIATISKAKLNPSIGLNVIGNSHPPFISDSGYPVQKAISMFSSSAGKAVTNELIVKTTTSAAMKSAVSTSVGTAAGLASGVGLTSGVGVTTAVVSGLSAASAAPVVATVAAVGLVGYGVKKLVDWVWD